MLRDAVSLPIGRLRRGVEVRPCTGSVQRVNHPQVGEKVRPKSALLKGNHRLLESPQIVRHAEFAEHCDGLPQVSPGSESIPMRLTQTSFARICSGQFRLRIDTLE